MALKNFRYFSSPISSDFERAEDPLWVQSRKQTSLGLPFCSHTDTQPTEPQPRDFEFTGTVLIGP